MVSQDTLPRDENGIVQGAYRILHEDRSFHGDIGVFEVREGQGTTPASGRALLCAIGEYGSRLYLEPWGDELPPGFVLGELISPDVPESTLALLERCPWRDPAAPTKGEGEDDKLDDLTVEELRELAESSGLKLAKNIGKPKALVALRAAGVKAPVVETETEDPAAPTKGEESSEA